MRPAWATFDCYGTLIDWEGGFGSFLYARALRQGEDDPAAGDELRERFEAIQFELIGGDYRPYGDVLAETLRRFCDEFGWPPPDAAEEAELVRAMRSWQPFPDTRPALERTRAAGMRLMIVSNTDRDIMAHSLKHIGVPFDQVQVAEDVGAYKPADEVFAAALERIGEPPENVLHVAFGFKYDIAPAARAGMRTAWVNRHQAPPPGDAPFDHEWRDLWGLAELAGSAG
ncbi:MAG TPA: haloacid dehalogenase type II [Thermoleophilaceae bacterium]